MEKVGSDEKLGSRSIELPVHLQDHFRHLKDAKLFALDIGGSLTKIAYFSTISTKRIRYEHLNEPEGPQRKEDELYEVVEGGRLHFVRFETKHIDVCLDYIRATMMTTASGQRSIPVTGGGAFKYTELISEKLGLSVEKQDEMLCMVQGTNFVLRHISDESFVYNRKAVPEYKFTTTMESCALFPYLLVTIGSGVSILKVIDDDGHFERVGGTATGGGTFWGLGKLLTGAKSFDELLHLASRGDHRNVDMLVKDIYVEEDNYKSLALPPELLASSMGKAVGETEEFDKCDLARSLLYMISNDIGQIASLYAMQHSVQVMYFGGFFLRHHAFTMHTIAFSVNFWTKVCFIHYKGGVEARFLRHEGYLGAIGAFLRVHSHPVKEDHSWTENTYASSSFPITSTNSNTNDEVVDHLEMSLMDTKLTFCPLLASPSSYIADTVDLTEDGEAREYWLQCLEDSLPRFAERALRSQSEEHEAEKRAEGFEKHFLDRLRYFRSNPFAHGSLSVRALLDLREQCLAEFDFYDPYRRQKQIENDQALLALPSVLSHLEQLDWEQRQVQLVYGMLAGNVFDWGAKEVALMLEDKDLDFQEALKLIKPRPWLIDDLDPWLRRLRNDRVHKCASIFVDNSGVDVILGMLPFVIELLRRGTQVILCANHKPVLNDVTNAELLIILQKASSVSDELARSLASGHLVCLDSGQSSPCLDLAKLPKTVVEVMEERGVDLIVLEGMGRAIHTNLEAKFKCESIKVAVVKNRWLANRLGGDMFSVVFKYDNQQEQRGQS